MSEPIVAAVPRDHLDLHERIATGVGPDHLDVAYERRGDPDGPPRAAHHGCGGPAGSLATRLSGCARRVLEKAGFRLVGEIDDEHEGTPLRVLEWELHLPR